MTEITFVKTRYVYDSYGDLFHLAALAGFPSIYVDELDVRKPGVFIVAPCNGEWRPHIDNQSNRQRNAHLIIWNIERPSGSAGSVGKYGEANRELLYQRHADEVFVSDRRLAQETELRFVPLGSHPDFGRPGKEKKWDVTHQSYENPRRQTIYKAFDPNKVGQNYWPPERDEVLRESKFGLATHQDNHPFCEPLRLSLFAAYGLPIVSETVYDAYPWGSETMVFSSYDLLAPTLNKMLEQDYERWRLMGLRGRKLMTEEFEFGKVVREAVDQSVGSWR